MMEAIVLFSDASVSPQKAVGAGAFFFLKEQDFQSLTIEVLKAKIPDSIVYREFATKKSTYAEIKTVLEALTLLKGSVSQVQLFTDCQNLCYLLGERRSKLEKAEFITRTGKELAHAELYRELFAVADLFELSVVKLEGHKASKDVKSREDILFQILDKSVRNHLRTLLGS